jgi:hypothetical protein
MRLNALQASAIVGLAISNLASIEKSTPLNGLGDSSRPTNYTIALSRKKTRSRSIVCIIYYL